MVKIGFFVKSVHQKPDGSSTIQRRDLGTNQNLRMVGGGGAGGSSQACIQVMLIFIFDSLDPDETTGRPAGTPVLLRF